MSDARLQVHPNCLMFFMDETGHEEFADRAYPVFGIGGIAIMARDVVRVIEEPWRLLKAQHFADPDRPLHASKLRHATLAQQAAIGDFFKRRRFGRFAAMMHAATVLPPDAQPIHVLSASVRKRWEELLETLRWPRRRGGAHSRSLGARGQARRDLFRRDAGRDTWSLSSGPSCIHAEVRPHRHHSKLLIS